MGYKEYDDEQPLNEEQVEAEEQEFLHEAIIEAGAIMEDSFHSHAILALDHAGNTHLTGTNYKMIRILVEEMYGIILTKEAQDGE